jgi:rod shape-determining protein MreB
MVREPSVVAVRPKTHEIIAIGESAYSMIGRTNHSVEVVRPIEDGVISDYRMAQLLLKHLIGKVTHNHLLKPRVICCVPSVLSGVESQSVIDAGIHAGARQICLIDEPVAAALGAGMNIEKAEGCMVVDIGGGTSDFAVLSLGGVVCKHSVRVAGSDFDEAIIRHMRQRHSILIGEKSAEETKIAIGGISSEDENREAYVKGRNLVTGLPAKALVSTAELYPELRAIALEIISGIQATLERTPPELVGDIQQNGLVMTGGGALLEGFCRLVTKRIGVDVRIADNAADCAALGTMKSFKYLGRPFDGFVRMSSRAH